MKTIKTGMPPVRQKFVIPGVALCGLQQARRARMVGHVALILVLGLLIPPHGILSENEENYFALGERFINAGIWRPESAVFDGSPHRTVSDAILGVLVSVIGYSPTQVVTRILAVIGYALTLAALLRVFALSTMDAAVIVMTLALLSQHIVGGEWLFESYEAKVSAYILVLAGLRSVLIRERLVAAVLLFAAATYFHVLVGGFWFAAAMVLRFLSRRQRLSSLAPAMVLFGLLVAPLAIVIAWSRFTDMSAAWATDLPPPAVIYSIIREPWHQSPFLNWRDFMYAWLPGYMMAAVMFAICLWVVRYSPTQRLRVLAIWLAGLLAYLFLILVPKYLDRDIGALGKFYLFRPSSLILMLWLVLALATALELLARRGWLLRAALVVLIGPAFLWTQGRVVAREIASYESTEGSKRRLVAEVQRSVGPQDIVLIDPDIEMGLLDFERRTRRSTWVNWKFTPTSNAEIILWYRRLLLRQSVFDHGCSADHRTLGSAFLLTTPDKASRLAASCGSEVFRVGQWVLLGRDPVMR